jgi:hypothetical protein
MNAFLVPMLFEVLKDRAPTETAAFAPKPGASADTMRARLVDKHLEIKLPGHAFVCFSSRYGAAAFVALVLLASNRDSLPCEFARLGIFNHAHLLRHPEKQQLIILFRLHIEKPPQDRPNVPRRRQALDLMRWLDHFQGERRVTPFVLSPELQQHSSQLLIGQDVASQFGNLERSQAFDLFPGLRIFAPKLAWNKPLPTLFRFRTPWASVTEARPRLPPPICFHKMRHATLHLPEQPHVNRRTRPDGQDAPSDSRHSLGRPV